MYRELGSLDAFGVPGGPYTGGPRTFRWHQLPAPVITRLTRCLAGEELPGPLLTASLGTRRRAAPLALATVLMLLPFLAVRAAPGGVGLSWLYAALFVAAFAAAGWLVQQAARQDKLRAGVYLFPLDIVEAHHDTIRISPFGSLKNAGIRREGSTIALELTFDHGARYRFACADEAAAERAYARIQEAHAAVERVTYGRDLEETVDLDPFFALRGEAAWVEASAPARSRAAPREALGALVGMSVGLLGFVACMMHVDNGLYAVAAAEHTEASYSAYLQGGGRANRRAAEQQIRAIRELAAARLREAAEEQALEITDWRHQPDISLPRTRSELRRTQQDEASRRYTLAIAVAPKGPRTRWDDPLQFGQRLERIFEAARNRGDDRLYVSFQREVAGAVAPAALSASLDERERRLHAVLARILGETIPADLVAVTRTESALDPEHELTIQMRETVLVKSAGEVDIVFDVVPIVRGHELAKGFRLRMPAPAAKLERVRPRSLFEVTPALGERRDIDLLTARAFDRLYDEVYGLFFPGDPKVPIALEGAKTP